MEMSYMPLMLKLNSFDTICHEHLEYYSLSTLNYIAKKAGLRIRIRPLTPRLPHPLPGALERARELLSQQRRHAGRPLLRDR
jgi:hypothetical protein